MISKIQQKLDFNDLLSIDSVSYLQNHKEHSLKLQLTHKVIYFYLFNEYHRIRVFSPTVHITQDRITANTNLSRMTASRVVSDLEKAGIVHFAENVMVHGKYKPRQVLYIDDITQEKSRYKLKSPKLKEYKKEVAKNKQEYIDQLEYTNKHWANYQYNSKIEVLRGEYFGDDFDKFTNRYKI